MPIEWVFIQIFVITVEITVLFYLFCSKFKAKYNSFIPTMFFVIGNILFIFLSKFVPLGNLPIAEILSLISGLVFVLVFRSGNILKKIFWALISFALLFSIAYFSITIIAVTRGVNSADVIAPNSTELLLAMVVAKTLQVVIFYILAKKKNFEPKNILSIAPMVCCLIVPFLNIVLIFFINDLIHKNLDIPDELIFIVSISYLVINIIIFVLYEIISREAEKNYVLVAKNKQYELTERHNNQVIKIYEKMREWRHDYDNHMQLVVGILEKAKPNGIVDEAIDYIKTLNDKIKSASLEIITGNYIVDAIISAKATLALSHNIVFEHNISLPAELAMDSTDLCSILSNLLDNAIEACCKLESGRYINLEMLVVRTQLIIKLINASDGEYKIEHGKLKTTKRGGLHGIGMGHIKSIAENYGGFSDIKAEFTHFTAQISIPLGSQKV